MNLQLKLDFFSRTKIDKKYSPAAPLVIQKISELKPIRIPPAEPVVGRNSQVKGVFPVKDLSRP
jgi:hypothetical protein